MNALKINSKPSPKTFAEAVKLGPEEAEGFIRARIGAMHLLIENGMDPRLALDQLLVSLGIDENVIKKAA